MYREYNWRSCLGLRYRTYLILASYDLKDTVVFSHGCNLVVRKGTALHSEIQGLEPDVDTADRKDRSDKAETKNKSSDTASADGTEPSDRRITLPSIPQS